ncbi:MAG: hypothetical protein J7604_04300 [Sporocytophaga sp.]|uniref:hypothetical protein n=1 Tax=Sporocytophaga sp. TaxID=2231183 RepID=UPI001AFFC7AE|nr:hypothetical protein [Sporocytophaga sp.]MBO9699406.1 hypothetical protein [Sporocytophaga sp.]
MKKIILVALLAISACKLATAQETGASQETVELRSKRGVLILPKKGEYAIGFSADPVLLYLGNFFNGGNQAPAVDYPSGFSNTVLGGRIGNAFTGKYLLDDHTAVRARFQFNFTKATNKYIVAANDDGTANNLAPQFAEDKVTIRNNAVLLALGLEKRRGVSRVQGVYGGEILLGFNKVKEKADYGNGMGANFPTPVSYENAYNRIPGADSTTSRWTEYNHGATFFAGVRGFAGIEYFFAPKISLGAEFGYTLGFASKKSDSVKLQAMNSASGSAVEYEAKPTPNNSTGINNFGLGLDNFNANLNLHFYF